MQVIHFSDSAIKAINQFKKSLLIPEGHFLRVGIKQKNSQDKGLIIGFDTPTEKDVTANVQGIDLVYHPGQVFFFAGMMIDYAERNNNAGFVLTEINKK